MSQIRQFDYVPEEVLLASKEKKEWAKPTKPFFCEGEAHFTVESIEDGYTKGDPERDIEPKPKTMFRLKIEDLHGKRGTYTVHALKSQAWQFMNILNSIGKGLYRNGGFKDEEVIGKHGRLIFGVEESERYGVQNKVTQWLPYDGKNEFSAGLPNKSAKADEDVEFDDIPF